MSGKPPGSFGWLGGLADSSQFSSNPVAYISSKAEEHGSVFCSKIASWPCVFSSSYKAVAHCLENVKEFPPHKSMLSLVDKCVGTSFMLDKNPAIVKSWRNAFMDVLYDGEVKGIPIPIQQIKPEWQLIIDSVVERHISKWVASGQVKSLYKSSKDLSQEVLCELLLGLSLADAKDQGFLDFITAQFRGCESLPVGGIPMITSTYETGVSARKKLKKLVLKRLESNKGGPLASQLLERCSKADITDVASHVAFLLHGMVPKALASGILYTWLDISHFDQQSLYKDDAFVRCAVLESLRLHPSAGVMGRGVSCKTFQGHELGKQHGEWKAWVGITSANLDKGAYGSTSRRYQPQRWLTEGDTPPPPLTFGHGPRSCIGDGIAFSLLYSSTKFLSNQNLLPALQCARIPPSKTLPVQRPVSDICCKFSKIS